LLGATKPLWFFPISFSAVIEVYGDVFLGDLIVGLLIGAEVEGVVLFAVGDFGSCRIFVVLSKVPRLDVDLMLSGSHT